MNYIFGTGSVPILNEDSYPLPTKGIVMRDDWPKRQTIIWT
jgi:hypothetical protein